MAECAWWALDVMGEIAFSMFPQFTTRLLHVWVGRSRQQVTYNVTADSKLNEALTYMYTYNWVTFSYCLTEQSPLFPSLKNMVCVTMTTLVITNTWLNNKELKSKHLQQSHLTTKPLWEGLNDHIDMVAGQPCWWAHPVNQADLCLTLVQIII